MATDTKTLQNFVDGEFVDSAEGETLPVVNPATGDTIAYEPLSSASARSRSSM